jgi:hypothetical protein
MFKPSEPATEPDLFSLTDHFLGGQALQAYADPTGWHNQFFKHVKTRIDESVFEVLYDERTGAPNAPVSVIVSMMILKEVFGWSDQQLFENCRFHMLVRKALGLTNMHDPVPVESTYYLFRKRMYEYTRTEGQDLMGQTFQVITAQQMQAFEVNGEKLRMDSKLFGSNIAWYSRYEVIHQSLIAFCKHLDESDLGGLSQQEGERLSVLLGEEPQKVVYRGTKTQLTERLQQMGLIIYKLLRDCRHRDEQAWQLLNRVFNEQYAAGEDPSQKVQLRSKEQIRSDSVQSPHDPECSYRKKGDQQVKGYVANITETTGDQKLNLISDVQVEQAHSSDTSLLTPALQGSQTVTGQRPEKVYVDGGYQSPDHDRQWPDTELVYTGIQGAASRYEHEQTGEGIRVTDTHTGQTYPAQPVKKNKNSTQNRWYIQAGNRRTYFNEQAIRAGLIRRQMKLRPLKEQQARNNVEATIYHTFCRMSNGKSRYRSHAKQRTMVFCRGICVNLHRIMTFESKFGTTVANYGPKTDFLPIFRSWAARLKNILAQPAQNPHFVIRFAIN